MKSLFDETNNHKNSHESLNCLLASENQKIPGLEAQVISYKKKITDTKVEMSLTIAKNRDMQKEIDALIANQSGLEVLSSSSAFVCIHIVTDINCLVKQIYCSFSKKC